jgi:chaperone BCS1
VDDGVVIKTAVLECVSEPNLTRLWWADLPADKARDVQISTTSMANNAAILLDDEEQVGPAFKSGRKLAYLPALSTSYTLWYKRRRITITRVQSQTGYYGSKEQTLYVRCAFFS